MKTKAALVLFLILPALLPAQDLITNIPFKKGTPGVRILPVEPGHYYQPFVMRNEAGADEFIFLPDGSRKHLATRHLDGLTRSKRPAVDRTATTLHLVFSSEPYAFFLSGDDITWSVWDLTWITGNTANLKVPPGNYDYIAFVSAGNKVLVKSNIRITANDTTLHFNFNDAINQVTFLGLDENGGSLNLTQGYKIASCNVRFPASRDMDYYTVLTANGTLRINSFDGGFSLNGGYYLHDISGSRKVYFPQFPVVNAVNGNLSISNDPGAYVMENLEFYWKSGTQSPNLLIWNCIKNLRETGWFYFAFGQQKVLDSTYWKGRLFLNQDVQSDIGYTTGFTILNSEELMPSWDETWFFNVVEGGLCNTFDVNPARYIYPDGATMIFGAGSAAFRNILVNNIDGESTFRCFHDIYGFNEDPRYEYYYDALYHLTDQSGSLIGSGPYMDLNTGNLPPAPYQLKVVNPVCYFADSLGSHQLITRFDLSKKDPDPPQLTSFKIFNADHLPVFTIHQNEQAKIHFSMGDYLVDTVIYYPDYLEIHWNYEPVVLDSVHAWSRIHGLTEWQELPLEVVAEDSASGLHFEGDLSSLTMVRNSRLDVKLSGYDRSGNLTEQIWEPAVFINDPAVGNLISLQEQSPDRVRVFPNPASGEISFEIESDREQALILRLTDNLGREVKVLCEDHILPGKKIIRVDLLNDTGMGASPAMLFYHCQIGDQSFNGKIVVVHPL
ncbi:MAG TPA: hypothetical protein PL087_07800 [Bacteroidales bacterium]|nr:hypothetical protein [Bacteroidales bacterium]